MEVFIAQRGKTSGPFTPHQIRSKYDRGTLRPEDHIWYEGAPEWMPASWITEWQEFTKATAEQKDAVRYLHANTGRELMFLEAEALIAKLAQEQKAEKRLAAWRERYPRLQALATWCEEHQIGRDGPLNVYRLQEALQVLQSRDHERFVRITFEELLATYESVPRMHWEDEPATAAQIGLLTQLGIAIPGGLSKGDAAAVLDGVHLPVSEGQIRRLTFYGLRVPSSRREASRLIDEYIVAHPGSEEKYQRWKRDQGIT